MKKTESRYSDQFNPRVVIQYAAEKAQQENKVWYVYADLGKFIARSVQPSYKRSHWKIEPNGSLFAHLAEPDLKDYKYEESNESR